ncbi:hypothetical protein HYPSUDRAFT_68416 [Hypholoma sublateritium FD-334 SS-4]|uniref:Carboxylic ester hydrolase n=1 Tax=Hypholoma sublateritium (strain FD-334 SS-4) TaxID=945553 RepID=A0A0D2MAY5_HYPSF|nr:hypothetical protein HYPSUDRAFT_68416 [Hypholoma sublateritium FD-334 SS-4]
MQKKWLLLVHGFSFLRNTLASPGASSVHSPPIVDLGYAKYQGISALDSVSNKTNTNFLSIRYAAPPTGTLRFAAPKAPEATKGVQLASAQPDRCWAASMGLQPASPFVNSTSTTNSPSARRAEHHIESRATNVTQAIPPSNEDCLFLNVFVPGKLGEKSNLPVVVWIHGGGYAIGGATGLFGTDVYDGNDLIREAGGNVVVVVIQYRLGLFGFLAGQDVKDGGVLNAGLLDQQFALTWVQQHIESFGGDPGKVTLWGQSAGAGSITLHLLANGGNTQPPLFRAAITSSTFLPPMYLFNEHIPETLYNEVVSQSNCAASGDALSCLRQADITVLQAANTNISTSAFFGTFAFVPVVDGTFITERPTQLLKSGRFNAKHLYSVTNTFEGAIWVDPSTANTVQTPEFIAQIFPNLGANEIQAAASQYVGLGSNLFQAIAVIGESIFICPTYYLTRAFNGTSFKGELAIPPGNHGDDLSYYYPTTNNADGIPPYANPQFDASFAESYLKFAMSLTPNAKFDTADITPHWDTWKGGNEMLFNRTEGGAPDIRQIRTSAALLKRCAFWESVGSLTGQ